MTILLIFDSTTIGRFVTRGQKGYSKACNKMIRSATACYKIFYRSRGIERHPPFRLGNNFGAPLEYRYKRRKMYKYLSRKTLLLYTKGIRQFICKISKISLFPPLTCIHHGRGKDGEDGRVLVEDTLLHDCLVLLHPNLILRETVFNFIGRLVNIIKFLKIPEPSNRMADIRRSSPGYPAVIRNVTDGICKLRKTYN